MPIFRRTSVAYVSQDQEFLSLLGPVLDELQNKGQLTSWQAYNVEDSDLPQNLLFDTDLLLLLISPAFVESHFFSLAEASLLHRYELGVLCTIPLHLRPTFWYNRPLAQLRVLPPDGFGGVKALTEWKERNRSLVLKDVQGEVIALVEEFEREQPVRMSQAIQALTMPVEQGWAEAVQFELLEQLFALCQKLAQTEPEIILPLLDHLADLAEDQQPDLASRCRLRAATIRQPRNESN